MPARHKTQSSKVVVPAGAPLVLPKGHFKAKREPWAQVLPAEHGVQLAARDKFVASVKLPIGQGTGSREEAGQ